MDARQRLLDALADVDRLKVTHTKQEVWQYLYAILPTLSSLRDELEAHCKGHHSGLMVDICVKCDDRWPCPTLRTLTRQFEEE